MHLVVLLYQTLLNLRTKKASEFLDHHLQPLMGPGMSYGKGNNGFLSKLKNLNKVLDNAILVRAEIYVGLFGSSPKVSPKEIHYLAAHNQG